MADELLYLAIWMLLATWTGTNFFDTFTRQTELPMHRISLATLLFAALLAKPGIGQEHSFMFADQEADSSALTTSAGTPSSSYIAAVFHELAQRPPHEAPDIQLTTYFRQPASGSGGSSGSSGSGGAGAAAAVNPSVPLTQIQLQNVWVPDTYNASGFSNQFILQPVLPFNISEDAYFPYHIMRPTLPIIAPTADPDGLAGTQGGLGDLTLLDVFVHPMKRLKTSVGVGYVAIIPTATHAQLGLREWQLGPSAFMITRVVPKWVIGAVVQVPFSMQSDAYSVQTQLIATRLLHDEWYVGWGDQLLTFDDQNGNYNIPINLRIGKVVKCGQQPLNIFLQGNYTPEGFREGPAAEWGIKLSVTWLFPEARLHSPLLSHCRGHGRR